MADRTRASTTLWQVSAEDRRFSIATVSHFGYSISFREIAGLFAEHPDAFNLFLEEFGAALAEKFGEGEFLNWLGAIYANVQPPIKPPQPFDKDDGH